MNGACRKSPFRTADGGSWMRSDFGARRVHRDHAVCRRSRRRLHVARNHDDLIGVDQVRILNGGLIPPVDLASGTGRRGTARRGPLAGRERGDECTGGGLDGIRNGGDGGETGEGGRPRPNPVCPLPTLSPIPSSYPHHRPYLRLPSPTSDGRRSVRTAGHHPSPSPPGNPRTRHPTCPTRPWPAATTRSRRRRPCRRRGA